MTWEQQLRNVQRDLSSVCLASSVIITIFSLSSCAKPKQNISIIDYIILLFQVVITSKKIKHYLEPHLHFCSKLLQLYCNVRVIGVSYTTGNISNKSVIISDSIKGWHCLD